MTGAENNNDKFTNRKLLRGEDIEAGGSSGHFRDMEKLATPFDSPLQKIPDEGNIYELVDDIDKWAGSLLRILEDVPQYMCSPGHPGRISRIPGNLREAAVKAYEPYILSFGPYHHGKPKLKSREKSKRINLKCFLEQKPEVTLKDYLMEMKCIESAARSFYTDVEMESETFLQMLLFDSLFILSKFCGIPRSQKRNKRNTETKTSVVIEVTDKAKQINEGKQAEVDNESTQLIAREDESDDEANSSDNYVNPPAWFWASFVHDLLLLENQLPFFVLQRIYDLAFGSSKTQLVDIMKDRMCEMLWDYTKLDSGMSVSPSEEVHHLLHLCHMFFRPTLQQESVTFQLTQSNQNFRLGSAVQLYESGVSFMPRSNSTQHSLLDITFDRSGEMVMPCLNVDDNTDSLLRNLIALEQMKYPRLGLDISSYVVLLLHLVTTPEDAKLLRRKGIIQHHLSSDKEMMYLINQLSVGLAFDYVEDRYGLKPVFQELKRYTERRVPQWRAWLKHRYFHNPWTVISLLAASLLLLLCALQTFYQVYSYYH